jgi:Carboxypeptidase regulatory-like domain
MVRTFRALMLLAGLACAPFAHAQSVGGHIAGVITDEQGVPVRDVFVTAHGTDQSQRMKTDASGQFRLRDLVAGRYVLTAALDGYTTIVRNGVMVRGGKTAMLPLVIKVVVAVDPQPQAPAAPVRNSRFRGLNAGTVDGTLPAYNPIESLPPSTVVLVQPTAGQTRR